ncbi:Protein of unknown function [Pyronema omphalodes CBS 100304]|uniref:Uncharacterized protein n=1 Tax=Pyronema omphalodes (strain CBS 100304) TaxID=1076935 RepID=U4LSB3_PYROM|nr:Protein of unknown function [Pyronema omphalodes CBS 100304]
MNKQATHPTQRITKVNYPNTQSYILTASSAASGSLDAPIPVPQNIIIIIIIIIRVIGIVTAIAILLVIIPLIDT